MSKYLTGSVNTSKSDALTGKKGPSLIRKCAALAGVAQRFPVYVRCSDPPPTKLSSCFICLSAFFTTPAMKVFKKQLRRLRSRIASRGSSAVPAEGSDIPTTMQPSTIPSDSNTLPTPSKGTDDLALETQHIDSDMHEGPVSDVSLEPRSDNSSVPNIQTKASDITNMQHVDPDLMNKFGRFRKVWFSKLGYFGC